MSQAYYMLLLVSIFKYTSHVSPPCLTLTPLIDSAAIGIA
jgi:hypothetical protein